MSTWIWVAIVVISVIVLLLVVSEGFRKVFGSILESIIDVVIELFD